MAEKFIYLDHAATTPVHPDVASLMMHCLTTISGNPSSLHQSGQQARTVIEKARVQVAALLNANPSNIVFTGSGSEADNLAVLGVCQTLKEQTGKTGHLITSVVEHPAVMNPVKKLESEGWDVTVLPVNEQGVVSEADFEKAVRPQTVMVSVMLGNNEVGSLQPLQAIANMVEKKRKAGQLIYLHTDAVQVAGKLPVDVKVLGVDYMSISAHKIYGAKGVGALYVSENAPVPSAQIFGGGQESGLRSGTENIAGIAGFGLACELRARACQSESERLYELQQYFVDTLRTKIPKLQLNGPEDVRQGIPGLVNFSFPELEGEALVLKLDMKGIAVSSGSACHSKSIEPSSVVLAMTGDRKRALSTVRFSMGASTTKEQLDRVVDALTAIIEKAARKREAQSV